MHTKIHDAASVIFLALFAFAGLACWATHLVVAIADGRYLFAILGAIVAPVGMLHGAGVMLGVL